MDPCPSLWKGVLRRLASELPPIAFEAWLRPLAAEPDGDGLRLLCPSPFHRDRVRERYLAKIVECAAREGGRRVPVSLDVQASDREAAPAGNASPGAPTRSVSGRDGRSPEAAAGATRVAPRGPGRDAAGCTPQRTLPYTFETFVVGRCNALAREAALALARGGQLALSPLYLLSAPGLGKTHLARAVAAEAAAGRAVRTLYASAEHFTSEFMASIRSRRTAEFKRRFREQCDLLVVDDVHFLANKVSTQLEFFHTLEHLRSVGAHVVLTGDRLPKQISGLDPCLESRLASGLVAEIEPPDATVRRRILRTKAAAGGVRLPDDCLDRLVEAVRGSVRDLESVLIQLVASASLLKRSIDLELTEAALRKLFPAPTRCGQLEPAEVIEVVCAFFGFPSQALASRSRRRDVLIPRQIAMYLCRRYTGASLKAIGRALGRDHPSVTNAVAAIERLMLERVPLRYQVEALSDRLDGRSGSGAGATGTGHLGSPRPGVQPPQAPTPA